MSQTHVTTIRRRRGFTLVEIILVVVIIMTLVAVVGPRLVGKSKKAKVSATKIQMHAIKAQLQEFEINAGRFPTTSEGLKALISKPSDLNDDEWAGKYADKLPKDSWQEEFDYKYPSENGMDYDLLSSGPDRQFGSDDDIANYGDGDQENL